MRESRRLDRVNYSTDRCVLGVWSYPDKNGCNFLVTFFILEAFMYPSEVVDRATLMACLSRMYKDYVRFCGVVDGGDFVFSEEDWLKLLQGLDHRVLARIISNFNEQELSVMSN